MGKYLSEAIGGVKFLYIIYNIAHYLIFIREYRNVFYLRIGVLRFFLYYLPPLSSLYIGMKSKDIAPGLVIQHGFSTIIIARHIGENCWINQQVTIGYNDSKKYGYGSPWIGDNVRISCGAKVVGKVNVGEGSVIGVNSVIVKDVPSHSVIVPSPMMMVRENGEPVRKQF